MLKRFFQALGAAIEAFQASMQPQAPARAPRPVWDDGTDYSVPTFIRQRRGFTLQSKPF